jgi:hypothetical protein
MAKYWDPETKRAIKARDTGAHYHLVLPLGV